MSDPYLIPVAQPRGMALPSPSTPLESSDWQRQHWSALLFGTLGIARRLLELIPAVAALGLSGNSRYIPYAIAIYFLFYLTMVLLRWISTSYLIDENSITLREGIFSRNRRQIGFDRIQDVSIEQNFIARALSVAKLGLETGAGGSGDDFALNPISHAKAIALRETLRSYRQQQSTAKTSSEAARDANPDAAHWLSAENPAPAEAPLLFALSPAKLWLSGLFSPSLAIIAFLFAAISIADRFQPFGYAIADPENWLLYAERFGLGDYVQLQASQSPASNIFRIAIIIAALAFIALLTGTIRTIFRDFNYRLIREPRALRRTRGLTTRTDVAITIRRIQSATIVSGLVKQLFGWQELRLRSLAHDFGSGSDGGDHQALPFAQRDDVNLVLDEIGYRPNWNAIQWQRSHILLALSSAITAALIILAGSAILYFHGSSYGWAAAALGVTIALAGLASARRNFHGLDGHFLLIRSGLLRPSTTIIPFSAIQSVDIRDNFLSRRLGLADLALGVPGISSFADDQIFAIPLSRASQLRAQLLTQDLSS